MVGALFPSSAANTLLQGYCEDFASFQDVLMQTLIQVRDRSIDIDDSREHLGQVAAELEQLSGFIREVLSAAPGPSDEASPATATDPADADDPARTDRSARDRNEDDAAIEQLYGLRDLPPDDDGPEPGTTGDEQARPARRTPSLHGLVEAMAYAAGKPSPQLAHTTSREDRAASDAEHDDSRDDEAPPTLTGKNSEMPLRSVFQFLERTRKSGIITATLAGEILTFEFDKGFVQSSATNRSDIDQRLGDLLVRTGICAASDILDLLDDREDPAPLGERVVRQGLATEGQVMVALEEQVRIRFERACDAPEATYEFHEGTRAPHDGRIRVAPMELTFSGPR